MGKDETTFDEKKIQYLQMIQSNISRMNTNSTIFKGLAITLIVGLALIQLTCTIFLLCIIPLVVFIFMDMYYLYLEKCYIRLYENVRIGEKNVDFSLSPCKPKFFISKMKKIFVCFLSPSVSLFYIAILLFLILKYFIDK